MSSVTCHPSTSVIRPPYTVTHDTCPLSPVIRPSLPVTFRYRPPPPVTFRYRPPLGRPSGGSAPHGKHYNTQPRLGSAAAPGPCLFSGACARASSGSQKRSGQRPAAGADLGPRRAGVSVTQSAPFTSARRARHSDSLRRVSVLTGPLPPLRARQQGLPPASVGSDRSSAAAPCLSPDSRIPGPGRSGLAEHRACRAHSEEGCYR